MKFLFDFFPILVFFAAYKAYGIFIATGVAIVATVIQVAWCWYRQRKVDWMLWLSLFIIITFGGATLILHDEMFIKWKPSVLYWLFAVVLLASDLLFKKNLMATIMGREITLPAPVWHKINLSWALFFAALGALNLFVAYRFSTDTWANFKVFGAPALMLLFALIQGLLLAKHMQDTETK